MTAITEQDYDGTICVVCPECGSDCSHIREVFTRLGSDPFEGGHAYQGTVAKTVTTERRDALVVVFDGECGHAWELVVQQIKGTNVLNSVSCPEACIIVGPVDVDEGRIPALTGPTKSPVQMRREWNGMRTTIAPAVFELDGYRCRICGATEGLTADHIVPIDTGGTNDIRNLRTLCRSCNSRKGAR